jgi:hypothetical protein
VRSAYDAIERVLAPWLEALVRGEAVSHVTASLAGDGGILTS